MVLSLHTGKAMALCAHDSGFQFNQSWYSNVASKGTRLWKSNELATGMVLDERLKLVCD